MWRIGGIRLELMGAGITFNGLDVDDGRRIEGRAGFLDLHIHFDLSHCGMEPETRRKDSRKDLYLPCMLNGIQN